MARHLLSVSGLGSPTAAPFIANMNAALSGLLNKVLVSIQIVMTDALPAYTRQIQAIVEYEDGGATMSAPYTVTVIESSSSEALKAQGEAYFAANPSSFISPVQFRYSDQLPNVATRYLSFYFSSTDVVNGASNYQVNGTSGGGGGSGTVTSVSVVTANGVSGSVATATTTPAITLTLGAITPTSVAATGTVTGSNLSGTNTGDQTITLTGDVTGSGTGSFAATIAANAVTLAKFQQITTNSLIGRSTAATGNVEVITVGSGLSLSGGVLTNTGATGTVTSVSVVTANGVSGSVATATTTPAITLTLGAITPTSVAAISTVTGSNLSGTNTGDQTITLTGDVTGNGTGIFGTTIAANAVTLAKMATLAATSIIGNNTGSPANPLALSGTQVTAMLDTFTSSLKGVVPASGGGTTNFLRADGTWAAPAGGGGGTVTNFFFNNVNGISGTVTNSTTTPSLTLGLGNITPTSVTALGTVNAGSNITASGNITGANLSGTNTGNQTITLTNDITGSGTGTFSATIVNGVVSLAKMSSLAAFSIIGNNSGGPATPQALSGTAVTAMLNVATTSLKGLTIALSGSSADYYAGNGTWVATSSLSGVILANAVILDPNTLTRNRVTPTNPAFPALQLRGASTQTANIQEWLTNSNVIRGLVNADGRISFTVSGVATNEFFGEAAGSNAVSGGQNTALGYFALSSATSATTCTAVGANALKSALTTSASTAVGANALRNQTGGGQNTAVGSDALRLCVTGSTNTAIGEQSMYSLINGVNNTAIGNFSLLSIVSSTSCVAVGNSALSSLTSGDYNTAVGQDALGTSTGSTNCSALGYLALASSPTVNNQITLGNSSITSLRCAVTTITAISDARDKANIVDLDAGLDFIAALRPVRFDWSMRDGGKEGIKDIGFLAQDLQSAQEKSGILIPNLVMSDNPDRLEAGYGMLLAPMVKAIQELRAKVARLEAR